MRSLPIYCLIYVFVFSQLAGCATNSQSAVAAATSLAQKLASDREAEKTKIQSRVAIAGPNSPISAETLTYWGTVQSDCAAAIANVDKQADSVGNLQLWIAIGGMLSGITGAAWAAAATHAKAAVSAASGIAGAANTAQTSIQTYKHGAQDLQTTASTLRAGVVQNGKAFDAATTDAAANKIARDTAIDCEFFSYQKGAAQK
jgi:hypothetical protein